MKLLLWNCRGMLSPVAVRSLLDLQEHVRPDVIFLAETHLNNNKADDIRRKLGFTFMSVVESDGRSRGLAMFWNDDNKAEFEYVSPNCIDVIFISSNNVKWRMTGFYGEPAWEDRHKSWTCLRHLFSGPKLPWIVMGDFNEIMFNTEKEGGKPCPPGMIRAFRECLDDCELHDMGAAGDKFTWRRAEVRERLDRAVCNNLWSSIFQKTEVLNEQHYRSDHRPVLVDTEFFDARQIHKRSGNRKFEARWLAEETVKEIVTTAWEKAKTHGLGPSLAARTQAVHADLHHWDRTVLKGLRNRIKNLKKELEKLKLGRPTHDSWARQKEIQLLIENLYEQEELHWAQRQGRSQLYGEVWQVPYLKFGKKYCVYILYLSEDLSCVQFRQFGLGKHSQRRVELNCPWPNYPSSSPPSCM